jgi:hypothetical protein
MEDLRYQGVRVFEEAMKRIEGKDKSWKWLGKGETEAAK